MESSRMNNLIEQKWNLGDLKIKIENIVGIKIKIKRCIIFFDWKQMIVNYKSVANLEILGSISCLLKLQIFSINEKC